MCVHSCRIRMMSSISADCRLSITPAPRRRRCLIGTNPMKTFMCIPMICKKSRRRVVDGCRTSAVQPAPWQSHRHRVGCGAATRLMIGRRRPLLGLSEAGQGFPGPIPPPGGGHHLSRRSKKRLQGMGWLHRPPLELLRAHGQRGVRANAGSGKQLIIRSHRRRQMQMCG